MKEQRNIPELKKAIKMLFGGLAAGTLITTGILWQNNLHTYQNRVKVEEGKIISTKTYGPFSHLEFINNGLYLEEISENSPIGYIKRIKLNSDRKIEKIIEETPNLLGKKRIIEYSIERVSLQEKKKLEKKVQEHIEYLYGRQN